MKQEEYLKPSEFYWGINLIFSVLFLVLYYITDAIYFFLFGVIFLVSALLINHNKKIKNKFDYKEV